MNTSQTIDSSEQGQSLVEFAISLVIILLLLVGIVDASRALFTYLSLRDAAEEAALYGSLQPDDTSGIRSRARNNSDLIRGLPSADVSITITYTGAHCTGNSIGVQIAYTNFPLTMPLLGTFIGRQTVPIRATVTNTILTPKCH